MKSWLETLLRGYSEIFFLSGRWLGLLLLGVTFLRPAVALAGLLAVAAAHSFARFVRFGREFLESGYYSYNPLLVGLSLGILFEPTPLALFFVVCAGILTFLLTVILAHWFATWLKLPILSLPFVVVSSMAYLAAWRYSSALLPASPGLLEWDPGLPFWAAGFLRSMGAIFFAPSVLSGACLSLVVLLGSRILFFLALLGYFTGAGLRALLLGSASLAFADINGFNFILIAMALGGVFLVASPRSYLLAAVAVALSTVVLDATISFWSYYGLPIFTLPFNLVTLGLLYVLGLLRHPGMALLLGATPEETLENQLAGRLRYRGQFWTLFLPFSGAWTVWQGVDGQWTHKGSWRHAYDFVITDGDGNTHKGNGARLEDYYAYGKPVLAPVRGRVVKVIRHLPDNPPGTVDRSETWGNLVIIKEPREFFVKLGHLAAGSIRVEEGEWVERGAVLGACGSSGHSPQPHIHVHVQASDRVGAPTVPFSFVSYTDGGRYSANDLPALHARVRPLYLDKRLDALTAFVLDEVFEYQATDGAGPRETARMTVKMALDGTFYLESGRGRLYFGKHEGTFYFYRLEGDDAFLAALFQALPRLPLGDGAGLEWEDYVPVGVVVGGWRRAAARFLSSFHPGLGRARVALALRDRGLIEGQVCSRWLRGPRRTELRLDGRAGFESLRLDGREWRRRESEAASRARG